jgi:hypothetical protein
MNVLCMHVDEQVPNYYNFLFVIILPAKYAAFILWG